MGLLLDTANRHYEIHQTVGLALCHFDKIGLNAKDSRNMVIAAGLAFSDEIILEKFTMWAIEREDEVLLFHVNRFLNKAE